MNNSPTPSRRLHPAVAGLIVIAMIGIIGAAAAAIGNHKDGTTATVGTTTPSTNTPPSSSSSTATSGNYKDGSYTASVNYFTPDGQEPLNVKVTLSGGTITATDVSADTISRTGQEYFDSFNAYYKDQVVGQKINGLSLSRVAGASLTTEAFDQALQQIMQNAAS